MSSSDNNLRDGWEEEDESHRSGNSSQLSLASGGQHDYGHRSRNNSEMSGSSNHSASFAGGGSSLGGGGGGFFADMTLDLNMAQMETTPRTDMKFASMASGAMAREVPPMPLIEEPFVDAPGVADDAGGSGDNSGTQHDNTAATTKSATVEAMPEQRSYGRIESGDGALQCNNNNNNNNNNNSPNTVNDGSRHRPHHATSHSSYSGRHRRPSRPPRRPRDVSWTAAALLVMPVGLLLPHVYYSNSYIDRHNHHPCHADNDQGKGEGGGECHPAHPSWSEMALAPPAHTAVLLSSLAAAAVSLLLLRLLYSHPGGGEGDDRRHVDVTRTLLLASNLCVWLNPLLALAIWHWLPGVEWAALLPLGLMARDGFRARSSGSILPRNSPARTGGRLEGGANTGGLAVSSSHDRKTFFRALAVASLDILSRSLRRRSFVRASSALLLVQFVCVSMWWGALSVVLSVEIFDEDEGVVTRVMHSFWLLATLVSGKWVTGTVARLLGFVASGGVAGWFASQNAIVERMMEREAREEEEEERRWRERQQPSAEASDVPASERADIAAEDRDAEGGYSSNYAAARAALHAMPEAYRSADASAYASVMDFDEGLDDDDDYEDDDQMEEYGFRRTVSSGEQQQTQSSSSSTTVKSFLAAGCTVSFGSVAQCGLLGGPAQFLWSLVRNIDAAGFFLHRRFLMPNSGFRGMEISGGGGTQSLQPRMWKRTLENWWIRMNGAVRGFVRGHSDLAMSHVAAYFKSYQRAANDVAVLIETSGVESIIHDDITTHMCSSLGHLVAGSIVLFFGALLVAHRNTFASALSDASLLETLLLAYVSCYTMLFTALEPLRAAIKAVYVCFAEHPASLGQAFPLIYQRLRRMSESSSGR